MSALNWAVDIGQSQSIDSLEEKVEKLEKDLGIAIEWIKYLNSELEKLKNEQLS